MEALSPSSAEKKRKRDAPVAEELEIDVDAPEPPSKKALRRAKKGKPPIANRSSPSPPPIRHSASDDEIVNGKSAQPAENGSSEEKKNRRGDYGVWIGNLPWQTDKAALRSFLVERGGLSDQDITRIHMPAPSKRDQPAGGRVKSHNKGFAYADFSTQEVQRKAIGMSETLLGGRALLIKDAQSFAGRPAEHKTERAATVPKGNPPNKRIFVGNLSFDMDKDTVWEHFSRCGDVEQVFLATFEDTGRCKGYGWVTFGDLESAERAVKGLVLYERNKKSEVKGKAQKLDALLLDGKKLRAEFAEDATIRYQKRFGKQDDHSQDAQ